jgi:hypothetical protein
MPEKKVRGLRRKTKNMIQRIDEVTTNFPTDFFNGYWHLHLPVAQSFISSSKTPFGIKRLCIQTLLNRTKHLVSIKPNTSTSEKIRVVVAIDLPGLWNSQIIVFSGDSYFRGFFDRNDEFQRWIPISKERNIGSEWGLNIFKEFDVLGFKEEITDEDGHQYKGEIWFVGELK